MTETERERPNVSDDPGTAPSSAARAARAARKGDATRRRKTQQGDALGQAQTAEVSLRALLESAPDGIVAVDRAGTIMLVNSQVEELFGYPHQAGLADRAAGARALPPAAPERPYSVPRGIAHAADGCGDIVLTGRRQDGSEFPVEISLSPLGTGEEQLL